MSKKLIYAGDQISLSEKQNLSVLLASVQEVLESGRGGWVEVRTNRGVRHILVNNTTSLQVINEKSLVNATQASHRGNSADSASEEYITIDINETSSCGCSGNKSSTNPAHSSSSHNGQQNSPTPGAFQSPHSGQGQNTNNEQQTSRAEQSQTGQGQQNQHVNSSSSQDNKNDSAHNVQNQPTPDSQNTAAASSDVNSPAHAANQGSNSNSENTSANKDSNDASSGEDNAIPMPASPNYSDGQNDASKAQKPQVTNDKGMVNSPSN